MLLQVKQKMIVVAQEGHIPDDQRGGACREVTSTACPSLPGAGTNVIKEKLVTRLHSELLPQSQSQSQAGSRR